MVCANLGHLEMTTKLMSTIMTKKRMENIKEITEVADRIHADLMSYARMPLKIKDGVLVQPHDFHTAMDDIVSYKMKNTIPLSGREVSYIWDRLIFRVLQSIVNGPPCTIDDCHHLLAAGLICYALIDSIHVNQTRRGVISEIIYYIDDIFMQMNFAGFSVGRYSSNRGDYFRRFSRHVVDQLIGDDL